MKRLITIALLTGANLVCVPIAASPRFPAQIASALGLSYDPPCSLCHVKGNTGVGTAQTPFAISMEARGLVSGGRSSVATALMQAERDAIDSDGDGIADVDELIAGSDPNKAEPSNLRGRADPSYGCGVAFGQGARTRSGVVAAVIAMMVALGCRRLRLTIEDQ